MILLSLMLLAGAPQPAPAREPLVRMLPRFRQSSDLCDAGPDQWLLSPASFPVVADDMPKPYDEGADPPADDASPDDSYAPDDGADEEQCPMMFVVPFDFWDGELWFDASAYGPNV